MIKQQSTTPTRKQITRIQLPIKRCGLRDEDYIGPSEAIEDVQQKGNERLCSKGRTQYRDLLVKNIIDCHNLLRMIDLLIFCGKRIAIIGRTSRGKSTLFIASLVNCTNNQSQQKQNKRPVLDARASLYTVGQYYHLFDQLIVYRPFIAINLQNQQGMKLQAISQNQDHFRELYCNMAGRVGQDGRLERMPISWAQSMRSLELQRAAINAPSPCKIEENPSYTFHDGQKPQVNVKIEQGTRAEESESLEMLMQRRAIILATKLQKNKEEKQEILQYRLFRRTQNYDKKILYNTRKVVADRRIRYKGKFINVYQAKEMLGLAGEGYSFDELKEMMNELHRKN